MRTVFESSILIGSESCSLQESSAYAEDVQFFKIPSTATEKTDQELSHFGRSLARDGFLSLASLDLASKNVDFGEYDKGRIGLYTAFMNGPILGSLFDKIQNLPFTEGLAYAKKWWPPKQHFRQNAPLRATHFAIKYKLNGPQMCFTHPLTGLMQAVDAAQIDLKLRHIDLAIVTSSFSFEDLQVVNYYSKNCKIMKEATASFIFNNPDQEIKFADVNKFESGLCTPITQIANSI